MIFQQLRLPMNEKPCSASPGLFASGVAMPIPLERRATSLRLRFVPKAREPNSLHCSRASEDSARRWASCRPRTVCGCRRRWGSPNCADPDAVIDDAAEVLDEMAIDMRVDLHPRLRRIDLDFGIGGLQRAKGSDRCNPSSGSRFKEDPPVSTGSDRQSFGRHGGPSLAPAVDILLGNWRGDGAVTGERL